MIPRLFMAGSTSFDSFGAGGLSEATECIVTEERNGAFTLKLKNPAGSEYADLLQVGTLIVADASPEQKRQAFEIVNVKRDLKGILTVKANHISYRLRYSILKPFPAEGLSAVMTRLNNSNSTAYYIMGNRFEFDTDITSGAQVSVSEYPSVRSFLGGMRGSLLDVYGGVYQWDNFKVHLLQQRGSDKGVRIIYGKNLTQLEADFNSEGVVAGVFPYYSSGNTVVRTGTKIIYADDADSYPYQNVISKSFNDDFETTPSASELDTAAAKWLRGRGTPAVNINTSFIPLSHTVEYADLANIESVELDDIVHVHVPTLDVDIASRIVSTKYNVLLDRYESVEVGSIKTSVSQAISDTVSGSNEISRYTPKIIQVYAGTWTATTSGTTTPIEFTLPDDFGYSLGCHVAQAWPGATWDASVSIARDHTMEGQGKVYLASGYAQSYSVKLYLAYVPK